MTNVDDLVQAALTDIAKLPAIPVIYDDAPEVQAAMRAAARDD